MTKTIAIMASLDTKGAEVSFIKEKIERLGCRTLVIDVGVLRAPAISPDVPRETIAAAAGRDWATVANSQKHERIAAMVEGAPLVAADLYGRGRFDAILSIGGVQNTTIAAAAMKALPIGVPKVIVSTVASGQRTFEPFVGSKDIVLIPSVADLEGINVLTGTILNHAVAAIVGMAVDGAGPLRTGDELIIGVTEMGVTHGVVQAAKLLEKEGYQVISFHSTGAGGRAMEELIAHGTIQAVLDLTLHEIVAEMFACGFSVGANNRLQAACQAGIPQVIAPGGADFIDCGVHELPADIDRRKYILHNSNLAHIKLHKDEIVRVGSIIVERLNRSTGPVTVLIPLRGFRQAASFGEPLWDAEVDGALIETLRTGLKPEIKVMEVDCNINDLEFSEAAAAAMRQLLAGRKHGSPGAAATEDAKAAVGHPDRS
jgi:uncharacterized protein (UPF0261 family)